MNEHEKRTALEAIRQAIEQENYVLTPHALLEMRNDHLDIVDVESAVLTGRIRKVFDNDPRGRRFEVVGKACDLSTDVAVVVRWAGPLLIITVYEM